MLLFAALALLFVPFSLSTIALLQRKEYRFDRLWVYLSESFELSDLFFRRPRWTASSILFFPLSFISFVMIELVLVKWIPFVFFPLVVCFAFGLTFVFMEMKRITIWRATRKRMDMSPQTVIGITGSYGKTTTKEYIATLLAEKFKVLKTPDHINTDIGVANVMLKSLTKEQDIFVVEMGAYTRGEIANICRMVRPAIGVLTGINEQHLALFGSTEHTMKAKGELVDALPTDGVLFFNEDDERVINIARRFTGKKIGFSGKKGNQEAAIAIAKHFGLSGAEIKHGLDKLPKNPISPKKGLNGATFLDDSYSSNPTGFSFGLDILDKEKGRKIVITPGIIELGSARERVHKELGQKIKDKRAHLIVTQRSFAPLFGIERWCSSSEDDDILAFLKKNLTGEDAVLVEGRISSHLRKALGL